MQTFSFSELGLSAAALKEISKKGFEEPTEIQSKIIPAILKSEADIIGQAQTGTGKTAAFGLPLLELLKKSTGQVQALVLTPTRELAIQVAEEINSFKWKKNMQIIPVYGGQSIIEQIRRLESGVDIVAGTPGRVLDHIKRKTLNLANISHLVIDEADEMLNMGFIDEVEEILKHASADRRTYLFSATMPARVMDIAKNYMRAYDFISAEKKQLTVELTDQIYFETAAGDKFEALCRIIDVQSDFYGLIFCRTKVAVDELANKLIDRGYGADAIHGDLSQSLRERILDKFKKKRIRILVATDVAARGIDVENLSHVINFSLPQDPESYVHRIGRTGRAGKKGIAVTFITQDEYRKLMYISKFTGSSIRKEKLPGGKEIVKIKKARMSQELRDIIENKQHADYIHLAAALLEENDPLDLTAAILKYTLEDDLDESKYRDIAQVTGSSIDRKGRARLFVSFGRKDGLDPRKLVKLINNRAGVRGGQINEVKVMDSFSFMTVPFREAEIILGAFSGNDKGLPLIQKAGPESKKPDKNKRDKKKYKPSPKKS